MPQMSPEGVTGGKTKPHTEAPQLSSLAGSTGHRLRRPPAGWSEKQPAAGPRLSRPGHPQCGPYRPSTAKGRSGPFAARAVSSWRSACAYRGSGCPMPRLGLSPVLPLGPLPRLAVPIAAQVPSRGPAVPSWPYRVSPPLQTSLLPVLPDPPARGLDSQREAGAAPSADSAPQARPRPRHLAAPLRPSRGLPHGRRKGRRAGRPPALGLGSGKLHGNFRSVQRHRLQPPRWP